jgi:hypothetical protein
MGQQSLIPTDLSRELRVIGAGSRTGTVSFSMALEQLLNGPYATAGPQYWHQKKVSLPLPSLTPYCTHTHAHSIRKKVDRNPTTLRKWQNNRKWTEGAYKGVCSDNWLSGACVCGRACDDVSEYGGDLHDAGSGKVVEEFSGFNEKYKFVVVWSVESGDWWEVSYLFIMKWIWR